MFFIDNAGYYINLWFVFQYVCLFLKSFKYPLLLIKDMGAKQQTTSDAFVEAMLKSAQEKRPAPKPQSINDNLDVDKIEQLAESLKSAKIPPARKR